MEFDEALNVLGFGPDETRNPRGARAYSARPNPFLTYTLQALPDGTALFSFEFAIGEYLATKGIQIGSDEALNQFAYPREDFRGPQEGDWLLDAARRAEALLADVRLDEPT